MLIELENSPAINKFDMKKTLKVLVADPISPKGVELLKNEGFETVEAYGSTPEQVKELIKDADAVIVRSETKITADVLACAKQLKAVGRAGVGVDNIDIPAASEKGVVVMNTPTGNTIATAELTFTHMLCGTRPISQANASIHNGVWDRKSFKGTELKNKTLAVLGMGRIGAEVAKRAMAFGMKVIGCDLISSRVKMLKNLGIEAFSVPDMCESINADGVFMTSGSDKAIDTALKYVKDGGKILVFSSTPNNQGYPNNEIYYRELTVLGSYSPSPADLKDSLKLLADKEVKVSGLSTEYPLEQIQKAINDTVDNKIMKAYIKIGE